MTLSIIHLFYFYYYYFFLNFKLLQAAGAVAGALAILEFMPLQYKHVLGGPSLKVDLHTGAIAEGVLTFIISLAILFIILRGPNSLLLKNWLIAMCTVSLVVAGSGYTGPAMNPANVSVLFFFFQILSSSKIFLLIIHLSFLRFFFFWYFNSVPAE